MNSHKSNNPFFKSNVFSRMQTTSNEVMTANGTINKASVLILIVFASALFGWQFSATSGMGLTFLSGIIGFVLAIITLFKPDVANITAPIYSIFQGFFLGGISYFFETSYPGIASQAVIGTISVFMVMLFLYRTGIIKVTERLRSIVIGLTVGIMFAYFISFILSIFTGQSLLYSGGTFSIIFSVLVIGVAAFNLLLDFDIIEKSEHSGLDKKMEWFFAFSLMVTLIWLYLEILRLLSLLRSK